MSVPLRNPLPLPVDELVPRPDLFSQPGELHGQPHVARVMIHAFLLADLLDRPEYARPLWAAVYLHDLARLHDGVSREHGADAAAKFRNTPHLRRRFADAGITEAHLESIETAVTWHSLPEELPGDHPHWPLSPA